METLYYLNDEYTVNEYLKKMKKDDNDDPGRYLIIEKICSTIDLDTRDYKEIINNLINMPIFASYEKNMSPKQVIELFLFMLIEDHIVIRFNKYDLLANIRADNSLLLVCEEDLRGTRTNKVYYNGIKIRDVLDSLTSDCSKLPYMIVLEMLDELEYEGKLESRYALIENPFDNKSKETKIWVIPGSRTEVKNIC
jgi:hypothetical protein